MNRHLIETIYNKNITELYISFNQVPADGSCTKEEWMNLHLQCAENKFCMTAGEFITNVNNYILIIASQKND